MVITYDPCLMDGYCLEDEMLVLILLSEAAAGNQAEGVRDEGHELLFSLSVVFIIRFHSYVPALVVVRRMFD